MGQRRKRDRKFKIIIWSPAITFALNQFFKPLSQALKIEEN